MDNDEKKSEQFLVRVEPDVHIFFVTEAKRRRIKIAQLIREVLYRHMEEAKKEKPNGEL